MSSRALQRIQSSKVPSSDCWAKWSHVPWTAHSSPRHVCDIGGLQLRLAKWNPRESTWLLAVTSVVWPLTRRTFWPPTNCSAQRVEMPCHPDNSTVGLEKKKRVQGIRSLNMRFPLLLKASPGVLRAPWVLGDSLGLQRQRQCSPSGLFAELPQGLWVWAESPGQDSGDLGSSFPPWPEQVTLLPVPPVEWGIGACGVGQGDNRRR